LPGAACLIQQSSIGADLGAAVQMAPSRRNLAERITLDRIDGSHATSTGASRAPSDSAFFRNAASLSHGGLLSCGDMGIPMHTRDIFGMGIIAAGAWTRRDRADRTRQAPEHRAVAGSAPAGHVEREIEGSTP
jgi:hypothetical protein